MWTTLIGLLGVGNSVALYFVVKLYRDKIQLQEQLRINEQYVNVIQEQNKKLANSIKSTNPNYDIDELLEQELR